MNSTTDVKDYLINFHNSGDCIGDYNEVLWESNIIQSKFGMLPEGGLVQRSYLYIDTKGGDAIPLGFGDKLSYQDIRNAKDMDEVLKVGSFIKTSLNGDVLISRQLDALKKSKFAKSFLSGKYGIEFNAMIDEMFDGVSKYAFLKSSKEITDKMECERIKLSVVAYVAEIIWLYEQDDKRGHLIDEDILLIIDKKIQLVNDLLGGLHTPDYAGHANDIPLSLPVELQVYRDKLMQDYEIIKKRLFVLKGPSTALRLLVLRAVFGFHFGNVTHEGIGRGFKFAKLIIDIMGLKSREEPTMKGWINNYVDKMKQADISINCNLSAFKKMNVVAVLKREITLEDVLMGYPKNGLE